MSEEDYQVVQGEETTETREVALVEELIKELVRHPDMAVKFVQALSKITKPWEALGNNGDPINEIPVPPGQDPKLFKKAQTGNYISGYRLVTIFGNEVAVISKDTPKWKVLIEGVPQVGAPFVQHSKKAESNAKEFAESILRESGYIIG